MARRITLLFALVLLAAMLVACGGAAPAAPVADAPAADAPAADAPAADAPAADAAAGDDLSGKVTIWGWSFDVMQSTGLFDEFTALHPNVELEVVVYNAGDTYQNLQLACSAGVGAPDVVQLENSNLGSFVALDGCLSDLTDQVTPMLGDFNAYKWVDAERDGRYYAVPWDSGPVVLYFRRDVFEKAGISTDPEEVSKMVSTWDGYLELCKTVKEETGLACFSHSMANNDARILEMALWQQGIGYTDADGNVSVADAQNVATLEKLGEFWDAGVTSDEVPWTDPWYAALSSLDAPVATIVEASWLGVNLKEWIAGDTTGLWGVAYMPAFAEGQPRASNDGGSTLAIPAGTQNFDAAWAFVEFMLANRENQIKQFAYSDFLPSLETTYDDPIFNEPDEFLGGQPARIIYLDVAKMIPEGRIYGPHYPLMHGHVGTAVQKFATGQLSAQDALNEAADAIRRETGLN